MEDYRESPIRVLRQVIIIFVAMPDIVCVDDFREIPCTVYSYYTGFADSAG